MKTINLRPLFVFLAAVGLAACQPTSALPTAAALPSQVVAALPTTAAAPRPAESPLAAQTLPATWTLTPTATLTATVTSTVTVSVTPSATITDTPTSTPTPFPTMDPLDRARTSLVLDLEARLTDLPPGGFIASPVPMTTLFPATTPQDPNAANGTPSVVVIPSGGNTVLLPTVIPQTFACSYGPPGGFATVYNTNPDLASVLGCATNPTPESIQAAVQPFQVGLMVWLNGTIYVFRATDNIFTVYPDTFSAGVDPETSSETPPTGFLTPMRGFLKVWSGNPSARDLGWALQAELGTQATVQRFERGIMIAIPGRQDILVLMNSSGSIQSGTWRSVIGQY